MSYFWIAVILLGAIVVFFLLLGGLTAGTGADLLDWDPIGHSERKAATEAADYEEMLALNNKFREQRGQRRLTENEVYGGRLRASDPGRGPDSAP